MTSSMFSFLPFVICISCGGSTANPSITQALWETSVVINYSDCGVPASETLGLFNVNWVQDWDGTKILFRDFKWLDESVFTPREHLLVAWSESDRLFWGDTEIVYWEDGGDCAKTAVFELGGEMISGTEFSAVATVETDTGEGPCVQSADWAASVWGL